MCGQNDRFDDDSIILICYVMIVWRRVMLGEIKSEKKKVIKILTSINCFS